MSAKPLVPVSERDYLEQDPPVRGQRYACVSFVSPEEVISDRRGFALKRYLRSFCASASAALDDLLAACADAPGAGERVRSVRAAYPHVFSADALPESFAAFESEHDEAITRDFDEGNGFRTSVRGIKVRGCYETLDEARRRGEALIRDDPKFHVYIGEVGCWCPWSPNPDDIKDEVFAETQLNTLVCEYKQNIESRKAEFAQRRDEMARGAASDGARAAVDGEIVVGGILRDEGCGSGGEVEDPWAAARCPDLLGLNSESDGGAVEKNPSGI